MINKNTYKLLNENRRELKEDRFDRLEYLYIDGSYALIRKYEQGPFLKKILNGNVFDRLYRYVSAGKLTTKDNPFNVKNWKVGDDILLGLTSTLPFEDPKNLKKDLQVNFSYCMVFKDVKGYSVKYDTKDFVGWGRGIERYKWQKEVLTAGLFHVDNIEQKGKITYVELSTVKQDKETFIEILRKTKKDLESGEFNKQYPKDLGVKYATYDRLKNLLRGTDLTLFNINNLSQKEIEVIKKLPKINTYEDLYYFIKEYGLYKDLKSMCTEEPPKEFTKEVWNNTLVGCHIALPEEAFPQSKKEAFNEWNCGGFERMEKEWPEVTGELIPFQNYLEGLHFIADKYFALKNIKEKLEKNSLEENRQLKKSEKSSKRDLCDEVEVLVKEAIEKTYNDSTKLSLMDDGVCIDKYGTKVFMLSGGLNGPGQWNEYLETLAQFTVDLIDKLRLTYGEAADVWLVDLKNDCADDIFYPVFGFRLGEDYDETESIEWQEQNTWQAEDDKEIPFEYDKRTDEWNCY